MTSTQCKHCRQTVVHEETEKAYLVCNCPEGQEERTIHNGQMAVERMMGDSGENMGFIPLSDELIDLAKATCRFVAIGEISQAAFRADCGDVIKISYREKDGKILVKRTKKTERATT